MSVVSDKTITARVASTKRRQVFKHALEKPYTISWPSATQTTQEAIIDALCKALQPVGAYFAASRQASKQINRIKRRRQRNLKKNKKKSASDDKIAKEEVKDSIPTIAAKLTDNSVAQEGQNMLRHLVLGINSTTRALEKQAQNNTAARDPKDSRSNNDLALVIVCKADIEPQVVAHFPALAHAARAADIANSAATTENTDSSNKDASRPGGLRLVGVVKGSEQRLAKAVCQQRVSAIGIRSGITELDEIIQLARIKVSAPSIPWIGPGSFTNITDAGQAAAPVFHQMKLRELHTTAPIPTKKTTK
ncbi:RNase P and RNase MRP subunit [Coemansia spiralis]|uniref:RNase P and RNase MRP subunit n=2 Tax=Coemansia TaxID=4863 RepID=A0A9W8KX65_9FUNG|nr:RNase P and RNase MRP subunit [Coemansia umbellata]KAJ2621018.1 RNase P and RNase MRP subunit [Coemansia sp. RSA 1358]KAJ2675767.1 RNase P and RNase MRP subunit [Coemansia spiralis]